jgi:hypothetical protein
MTIQQLIATHAIQFTCERLRPDEDIFKCRITHKDRGMTIYHLSADEPTLAAVLKRLVMSCRQNVLSKVRGEKKLSANRDVASFEHWCVLYGYDPKSPADRERYLRLRRKAGQLKYVLGPETYKELIDDEGGKTKTVLPVR